MGILFMENRENTVMKVFPALGTVNSIWAEGGSCKEAASEAEEYIRTVHDRLSVFNDTSEISEINRRAGETACKVSPVTASLIERSIRYSKDTGGAFDITMGTGIEWKSTIKTGRLPKPDEIGKIKELTGYKDILVDEEKSTVMLKKKGQKLDMGGLAKGYAADKTRNILKKHGVKKALLNFGGTIVSIGHMSNIGLQDPFSETGKIFAVISLNGKAAVSSGIYEQYIVRGGKRYHHIIDPKTGCPSDTDLAGVTLVGDSAEMMDAYATAIIILGLEKGLKFVNSKNMEAVFVTVDRKVFVTEGIRKLIKIGGDNYGR